MFVDIFQKKLANKFLDFLVVGISSKILRDMQGETIFEINRPAKEQPGPLDNHLPHSLDWNFNAACITQNLILYI